jgi:hypothetical protein
MAETEVFRTDDMALAAALAVDGRRYEVTKLTDTMATWSFEQDAGVERIVNEYMRWELQCEVRSYLAKHAELRREIYKIMPRRSDASVS